MIQRIQEVAAKVRARLNYPHEDENEALVFALEQIIVLNEKIAKLEARTEPRS